MAGRPGSEAMMYIYVCITCIYLKLRSVPLCVYFYPSISDPSLTAQNVRQVMEVVRQRKWRDVGQMLSVPHSIVDKIDAECSSHNEKISALADYVVTIIPGITWENVASNLYQWGKKRAVERAKPYLHIVPGES